jgi:hypothetical protein
MLLFANNKNAITKIAIPTTIKIPKRALNVVYDFPFFYIFCLKKD